MANLCNTCGRRYTTDTHTCPPKWWVRLAGRAPWHRMEIRAGTATEAAELFADAIDAKRNVDVVVQSARSGEEVLVLVTTRLTVEYDAVIL